MTAALFGAIAILTLIALVLSAICWTMAERGFLDGCRVCFVAEKFVLAVIMFSVVGMIIDDRWSVPLTEGDLKIGETYEVLWREDKPADHNKTIYALLEWIPDKGKRQRALFVLKSVPPPRFLCSGEGKILEELPELKR